jgi:hypothetical protein
MICTECSRNVGPIVILDIDGTLGDYHSHFLSFAGMYLGENMLPAGTHLYKGTPRFREWFCTAFDVDVRTFRDIKLAYRQGAQKRSMPVFKHARPLTTALREAGAEIWLATTRPYMRLDAVDPDTRWWLKRNGIKYDYLLYDDHKYELLARQIDVGRVVAVVDDLKEDLYEADRCFDPSAVFVYANSWNSAYVQDWNPVDSESILPTLMQRIHAWTATSSSSALT